MRFVVSSNWRKHHDPEELQPFFAITKQEHGGSSIGLPTPALHLMIFRTTGCRVIH